MNYDVLMIVPGLGVAVVDLYHADAALDGQPCIKAEPDGWSWVAPLGDDKSAWVALTVGKPGDGGTAARGGIDVSWHIHRACAGPGYFLLGDAAAVLDPLSSHGVLRALMSGMLCAHVIAAHRDKGLPESDIIAHYASWLGGQFDADVGALSALYRRHPSQDIAKPFVAA